MLKAAFHTLGCKLNFSETSTIAKQFSNNGFEIVDFNSYSDVYVINTCTVTENADRECRQIVRRALRNNPEAFVAVVGCYAQLRPEEIASIEGVDAVFGSNEKFNIFSHINKFEKSHLSCIYIDDSEGRENFHEAHSTDADSRTRAFLKIQDGCDYKCSFCTIPLARGGSRSQSQKDVISSFKQLLFNGYKEIVLTGVNVGDYSESDGENLYSLLSQLVEIEGDFRIRISSIEPNLLSEEIMNLTSQTNKLVNHFHIPLQSGSTKVLRLMKRRYDSELYRDLILKLTEKIPNIGIGADVIVGTPGETLDDFMETYEFIKGLPFSYLHVFTYSERPNTYALTMNGQVEKSERKKRNHMLRILGEKKKNEFYRKMIGKELTILFEGNLADNEMFGFSDNYVRVKHPLNFDLVNKFTSVKITDVINGVCVPESNKITSKKILTG
ncbi:MAG: tRNA (N(6)-L-threonylcarbamoyladenosine(37)-C(2))-methylthiotransferase MtaB [Melioribacteraceae bacterium]|nr:tRNA (N(6)-L-threonylcarbamoyladenosine(37)-C(2))-methylthiotransferase MtaB [Melioribacteraceae bacterium]MDD3557415.1 tRNA (N(6)-L-threonylcarbamoyladenosine(37)-C(2))-methylthiotransferase MtaB [Melioribacteraceae bacterium]